MARPFFRAGEPRHADDIHADDSREVNPQAEVERFIREDRQAEQDVEKPATRHRHRADRGALQARHRT